jgi:hypothetical protein
VLQLLTLGQDVLGRLRGLPATDLEAFPLVNEAQRAGGARDYACGGVRSAMDADCMPVRDVRIAPKTTLMRFPVQRLREAVTKMEPPEQEVWLL